MDSHRLPVAGANGVVYGTSEGGSLSCPFGCGLVFSLSPPSVPGGSWTETVLHAFSDQKDDGAGAASIVIGPQGVLYGTTGGGGTAGWGTVFSLTPPTARAVPGQRRYFTTLPVPRTRAIQIRVW